MRGCNFSGCKQVHRAKGYCATHYNMFAKYGNFDRARGPLFAGHAFIEGLKLGSKDECIEWPFGLNDGGYAQVLIEGRRCRVHIIVCKKFHGAPTRAQPFSLHKCGNRKCVNPEHLRWGSSKENAQDTILHGRTVRGPQQPHAKLTENAVLKIKQSLRDGARQVDLAMEYGVSLSAIHAVHKGRSWSWVLHEARK